MLLSGGHDIDADGVDVAVVQCVGKHGDVLFQIAKCPCKELPPIARKRFARIYICLYTKLLHRSPDIAVIHRRSRNKDDTGNTLPMGKAEKQLPELSR